MLRSIVATALFCVASTSGQSYSYSYDQLGADWPIDYPEGQCGGQEQSPIALSSDGAEFNQFDVDIQQAEAGVEGHIGNVGGNTFEFGVTSPANAVTVINPVNGDTYILDNLHFHWDAGMEVGSEHTMDGEAYPLEVHFVFHNSRFEDLDAAAADGGRDNLLVVGQFFEISEEPNPTIDALTRNIDAVVPVDAEVDLEESVDLLGLFADVDGGAFTYLGSLTTPTCNEIVQWVVLRTPATVTSEQLERLYLLETEGGLLETNYRAVQALNDRVVMRNFDTPNDVGPTDGSSDANGRHHGLFHSVVAAAVCAWYSL